MGRITKKIVVCHANLGLLRSFIWSAVKSENIEINGMVNLKTIKLHDGWDMKHMPKWRQPLVCGSNCMLNCLHQILLLLFGRRCGFVYLVLKRYNLWFTVLRNCNLWWTMEMVIVGQLTYEPTDEVLRFYKLRYAQELVGSNHALRNLLDRVGVWRRGVRRSSPCMTEPQMLPVNCPILHLKYYGFRAEVGNEFK